MARLIFCFFAQDTDIFNGTGLFTATIEQMSSARDSSNTHEVIGTLFRAMNTKITDRAAATSRARRRATSRATTMSRTVRFRGLRRASRSNSPKA